MRRGRGGGRGSGDGHGRRARLLSIIVLTDCRHRPFHGARGDSDGADRVEISGRIGMGGTHPADVVGDGDERQQAAGGHLDLALVEV